MAAAPTKILHWFDVPIRSIADHYGISQQAVRGWLTGGWNAPTDFFEVVAGFSPAAAEQLRPLVNTSTRRRPYQTVGSGR